MSKRKAEMVLELIDRATRPARRFMALQRLMGRTVKASNEVAARAARNTDRVASKTERTLAILARTGRKAFKTVARGARLAKRAVSELHQQTVRLGKFGVGQIGQGWNRARGGLLAGAAAVTVAYGAAAAAAGGLVGTASEFERFQTILMTTEGSAQAAQDAMGWVQNFAVKTPYELDQVTDAFVTLRAYGLDPTQGLLETLGDTSAAMSKPLGQAVEAIADAVTGENERLKEFGIKASKTGKQITYEYTNAAGESVRTAVDASNRMAIQQKLMAIMNEKYAGSMKRLSETWAGMVSNVSDLWTKFQMMIMNAGLFDWMKGKLSEVLDTISRMEADGSLQKWAVQIGQTIQTALSNIWEFGKGVWEVIQQVSGYLSSAADYVGGWKNLSMILAGIAFAPTLISTAAGLVQIASGLAALSAALLANPIGLAIAAIAGGVYLIYRNWDSIAPYFQRLWVGVKTTVSTVWEWMKTAFSWTPLGMIVSNWGTISAALSGPIEAGKAAIDVFWNAIKSLFNWNPLDAISLAWGGISAALSSPIESGKVLAITAWEGLKTLFSWHPVNLIRENWSDIADVLRVSIDSGATLAVAAWEKVKRIFSGDWLPEIDTSMVSAAMEIITNIVQRGWGILSGIFDKIVAGAVKLGGAVGAAISTAMTGAQAALDAVTGSKGVDRIFDQLDGLAERGFSADFVQGQALTEALSEGEVSLENYRQTLAAVSTEGGMFAQTAREMFQASQQLNDFSMPKPVAPPLPAPQETAAVISKLTEIEAIAGRVPGIVQDAIVSAQNSLDAEDFANRGARLMQTLADGIRSKVAEVTAAARAITRAITNALPRSATMNIGVQASKAGSGRVQARARGGAFGRGWLLTGEQGAELEYRTQGGFIAHNRALRDMVAMSQTVARNVDNAIRVPNWLKGAAVAASVAAMPAAASIPSSETSEVSGERYLTAQNHSSSSVSMPVTLTIQGNVDQNTMPDLKAALNELEDRMARRLESNARAARRQEHR